MSAATILKIVLASPGDVSPERDAADRAIRALAPLADKMGTAFSVRRWEDVPPGFDSEGVQARIAKSLKIEDCDLLIGIFWKRYGEVDREGDSRTAKEIREALAAKQETGIRPEIMLYFCIRPSAPMSQEETDQYGRVLRFKEELQDRTLTTDYEDVEDFSKQLSLHLSAFLYECSRRESQGKEVAFGKAFCKATGIPALLRSEGYTELVGDLLLTVLIDSSDAGGADMEVSLFATSNITNRVSQDRVTDVSITRKKADALYARGKMMLNEGLSNAIEFDPIRLAPGVLEEFRIRGIRVDAGFLSPGDPLAVRVVVTCSKGGVRTVFLTENVILGVVVWSVNFSAQAYKESIEQDGYALSVHYSETCPGLFKTRSQESRDGLLLADTGTVLCLAIANLPEEFEVYVTARDLPVLATRTSVDTLVRAIAVKANGMGRPVGHAEIVDAPVFPGGISMTRIDRSSHPSFAAWELVNPLADGRRSDRALSFGVLIVGHAGSPILDRIWLAGGYAPFLSSALARLPHSTLPIPRFRTSDDLVEVLLHHLR